MNIAEFQRRLAKYTKDDLLQVLENCKSKKLWDEIDWCKAELDRRFPDWQKPKSRRKGGRVPTRARFFADERQHESEVDAFVGLLNCLIQWQPSLFDIRPDSQSSDRILQFVSVIQTKGGERTVDLAKTKEGLDDVRAPRRLLNGWWVNTTLNKEQKHLLLQRIFCYGGLEEGRDWTWKPEGP